MQNAWSSVCTSQKACLCYKDLREVIWELYETNTHAVENMQCFLMLKCVVHLITTML
jgi:hypothetical protein